MVKIISFFGNYKQLYFIYLFKKYNLFNIKIFIEQIYKYIK